MKYIDLLHDAKTKLKNSSINTAEIDSELLLSKSLNLNREDILLNLNSIASQDQIKIFFNKINKRLNKEPIAYILGKKDFWKTNFTITKNVLIPRPETEIIVEQALKLIPTFSQKNILDIGTGSGCIIISILLERKKCIGTALDISKEAIKLAKYNAKMQHVGNRLDLKNLDIDNFFSKKYDLIVSNPPYIKNYLIKYLLEDVKNFEPYLALDGGLNGCKVIEKVIRGSSELLKRNGNLILEIDPNQIYETKRIMKNNNFHKINIIKDLSGNYRCIIARKN